MKLFFSLTSYKGEKSERLMIIVNVDLLRKYSINDFLIQILPTCFL
jgi:hypothetical protein